MSEYCDHCGASIVQYKHSLSKNLVKGLIVLDQLGGSAHIAEIGKKLTHSQRNNFQKLQYWLFIHSPEPRYWRLTKGAERFLAGSLVVRKKALSYRGKHLGFDSDSPMVNVFEALGDHSVWYREDYLKNREERSDK